MKKYFFLQGKRMLRYLPGAVCAVVVLLGALAAALSLMLARDGQMNMKVQIALVGDVRDPVLQMGMKALESLDSTNQTIQISFLDEQEAADALGARRINAYVVVPEDFMASAMRGEVKPMEFVSYMDSADLGAVFKRELTGAVATLVLESQRGVYGMLDALQAQGQSAGSDIATQAGVSYVKLVLARDELYTVQELGVAGGMDLSGTLLCGLTVLLVLLACLPFAPALVCKERSLSKVLAARGRPAWLQLLGEFTVYFLALLVVCLSLLLLVWLASALGLGQWLSFAGVWQLLLQCLPVVLMGASLSFLIYTLSTELISGVLLQFFVAVALCFVSGCIYPVSFFPAGVQKVAAWLPTGVAARQLSGFYSQKATDGAGWVLVGYSALLLTAAVLVGHRTIHRKRG